MQKRESPARCESPPALDDPRVIRPSKNDYALRAGFLRPADSISPPPGTLEDEQRLIAEVLKKDRKSTAEFVSLCADCVYPFVKNRVRPEITDDLVQEILLAAWQKLSSFRGDSSLRQWLLGIAHHKVQDHYRKRIQEGLVQEEADHSQQQAVAEFEERLEAGDRREQFDRVLKLLPDLYRVALIWRYRDGHSIREIARETGKTEKSIERLLARARESFKRSWNDATL